jgi:hypothetical protein
MPLLHPLLWRTTVVVVFAAITLQAQSARDRYVSMIGTGPSLPGHAFMPRDAKECQALQQRWSEYTAHRAKIHDACIASHQEAKERPTPNPRTQCTYVSCWDYHAGEGPTGREEVADCYDTVARYQEQQRREEADRAREASERERDDAERRTERQAAADLDRQRRENAARERARRDQQAIERARAASQRAQAELQQRTAERDAQRDAIDGRAAQAASRYAEETQAAADRAAQLVDQLASTGPSTAPPPPSGSLLDGFDFSGLRDAGVGALLTVGEHVQAVMNRASARADALHNTYQQLMARDDVNALSSGLLDLTKSVLGELEEAFQYADALTQIRGREAEATALMRQVQGAGGNIERVAESVSSQPVLTRGVTFHAIGQFLRGGARAASNPVLEFFKPFLEEENARNMYGAVEAARRQATSGTTNQNAARNLRRIMDDMDRQDRGQ